MLPLGEYRWGGGIGFRLPAGKVVRRPHPNNTYRLFAACRECDGPAELTVLAPSMLASGWQVFLSWEDHRGLMLGVQSSPCGFHGRLSLAQQSERGLLRPWLEGFYRIQKLGPDSEFRQWHLPHLGRSTRKADSPGS